MQTTIGEVVAMSQVPELTPGFRVLVAGVMRKNLPDHIWEDDRLIIWETGSSQLTKSKIPSDVQYVMMTRFMSHDNAKRIRNLARQAHIRCAEGFVETSEMRRRLERLLHIDHIKGEDELPNNAVSDVRKPTPAEAKAEVKAEVKVAPKNASEFIRAEFQLNPGETVLEATKRLWERAKPMGFKTTEKSFYTIPRALAIELGVVEPRKRVQAEPSAKTEPQPTREPQPVVTSPVVAPEVVPMPPVVAPPPVAPVIVSHSSAIIGLLDEAMAALTLAREHIANLEASNAHLVKMAERYERMKRLLDD
jgi:hypothetical protein